MEYKLLLALLLSIAFCSYSTLALDSDNSDCAISQIGCNIAANETIPKEEIPVFVDKYTTLYNEKIDKVPEIALSLFGNERVNLYVNDQILYGFRLEDGKIVEKLEGGIEEPTLNVYTTAEVIIKLINKEIGYEEALEGKHITYSGVGFLKKIKFGLVKLIQWLILPQAETESGEGQQPEEAAEPQGTEETGPESETLPPEEELENLTIAEEQEPQVETVEPKIQILTPQNEGRVEIWVNPGVTWPVPLTVSIPPSLMDSYINSGMIEYRAVEFYPTAYGARKENVPYGKNDFSPVGLNYTEKGNWVPLYCLSSAPSCDTNTRICTYQWYTYHLTHGEYELKAKVITAEGNEHTSDPIKLYVLYPSEIRGANISLTLREWAGDILREGSSKDILLPLRIEPFTPRYLYQQGLIMEYKKAEEETWKRGRVHDVSWPPMRPINNRTLVIGLYYLPEEGTYTVRAGMQEGWGNIVYSEPTTINVIAPSYFDPEKEIHLINPRDRDNLTKDRTYTIRGLCPMKLNYSSGKVEYKKSDREEWTAFAAPLDLYPTSNKQHICEKNFFTIAEEGMYNIRLNVKDSNNRTLYSEAISVEVKP